MDGAPSFCLRNSGKVLPLSGFSVLISPSCAEGLRTGKHCLLYLLEEAAE
jgi:hypothetical protein